MLSAIKLEEMTAGQYQIAVQAETKAEAKQSVSKYLKDNAFGECSVLFVQSRPHDQGSEYLFEITEVPALASMKPFVL